MSGDNFKTARVPRGAFLAHGWIGFDSGGGAVLVVGKHYAHAYDSGSQLARDVLSILCGADVRNFERHDAELSAELKKRGARGYDVHHQLIDVREALAFCNYDFDDDGIDITVNGCRISGRTEEAFWRAICVNTIGANA